MEAAIAECRSLRQAGAKGTFTTAFRNSVILKQRLKALGFMSRGWFGVLFLVF